jgi:hypothetical protein
MCAKSEAFAMDAQVQSPPIADLRTVEKDPSLGATQYPLKFAFLRRLKKWSDELKSMKLARLCAAVLAHIVMKYLSVLAFFPGSRHCDSQIPEFSRKRKDLQLRQSFGPPRFRTSSGESSSRWVPDSKKIRQLSLEPFANQFV